jgi:hypothetical protein
MKVHEKQQKELVTQALAVQTGLLKKLVKG